MATGDTRAERFQAISLRKGTFANPPPAGEIYVIQDSDGTLKQFSSAGVKAPLGGTTADYYSDAITRGYNLCGLSATASKVIGPFDMSNHGNLATAVSAFTVPTNEAAGGFIRNGIVPIGTGTTYPRLLLNNGTTRFWIGGKMRVLVNGGAAANGRISMVDPVTGAGAAVGFYGATSTTLFSAYTFDGASALDVASSTISIDANWHMCELWNDGAGFKFSIDSETAVSITVTHAVSAYNTLEWQAAAGTGGKNDLGWFAAIVAAP